MATKPLLRVRIITTPDHAQALMDALTLHAREILGDNLTYRTQTRRADYADQVGVHLTATRKETTAVEPHQGPLPHQ